MLTRTKIYQNIHIKIQPKPSHCTFLMRALVEKGCFDIWVNSCFLNILLLITNSHVSTLAGNSFRAMTVSTEGQYLFMRGTSSVAGEKFHVSDGHTVCH